MRTRPSGRFWQGGALQRKSPAFLRLLQVESRAARHAYAQETAIPTDTRTDTSKMKDFGKKWYRAIGQHLLGLGVIYNVEVFGPQTRTTIFTGLKHLMVQGKIQILDGPDRLRQLRTLRVEKTPRSQIDIRPGSGNDDIAVALALAANAAIMQKPPLTIDLIPCDPRPSAACLGLIPGNCYVESVCGNHPKCIDVDRCLGFLDLRLIQIAS